MSSNDEILLSELTNRFLASMDCIQVTGYKLKQNGIINNEATLTKIKKGVQQPSRKMLDKYMECYTEINSVWLLTGIGNMLKDSSERDGKNIVGNHIGTFNGPINTQIGDNIRNVIGDDKPKKVQKSSDKEIKLEKENSTLKSEISELKMKILELSLQNEANNKLIEEKERLINVLLNQR